MESMVKTWLVMLILFLSATYLQQCVNGKSQVPCLFIFGDSLSDSGNNNNLATSSKCNYSPYGIDFPNGPTGRFTNGRTAIDIISNIFQRKLYYYKLLFLFFITTSFSLQLNFLDSRNSFHRLQTLMVQTYSKVWTMQLGELEFVPRQAWLRYK
jgi:hypothetical protein